MPAQQGDCKTTQQSRSGNTMKFAVACTNPPSTGEGQVVFTSPETYTMKMVVNAQVQGKPEKMTMAAASGWGRTAANIKPMARPAKK